MLRLPSCLRIMIWQGRGEGLCVMRFTCNNYAQFSDNQKVTSKHRQNTGVLQASWLADDKIR